MPLASATTTDIRSCQAFKTMLMSKAYLKTSEYMLLKIVPDNTNIKFLEKRFITFFLSSLAIVATIFLLSTRGLNLGIDFTGGILMDVKFEQEVEIGKMRELLAKENLGEVSLQTFGESGNVLIRIGGSSVSKEERNIIIDKVKTVLSTNFKGDIQYRKVDYVGPKVGEELMKSGSLALLLSFVSMMIYIWFRFEWQYGVGGILALVHDAFITLGFFSLTQIDFNLTSIAAILTIIGYSINDSVVIFDRIRDNLRKYKKMPIIELLNLSINETITRTTLTSVTTIISLIVLVLVGGEVIRGFSLATMFGIIIGTFSSIYISAPVLIYFNLRPEPK
jgi:preprotein translocase SecF subunit